MSLFLRAVYAALYASVGVARETVPVDPVLVDPGSTAAALALAVVGVEEVVDAEELEGVAFEFEVLGSVFVQAVDQRTVASSVKSMVNVRRVIGCRTVVITVARCVVTFLESP